MDALYYEACLYGSDTVTITSYAFPAFAASKTGPAVASPKTVEKPASLASPAHSWLLSITTNLSLLEAAE